tara:strand:+ start:14528 stop:15298 length:771 start_codon:yes stop_codon:yes gene_type:complete
MKTLYLDFENGYKSLGSKEDISNIFGYPMLQYENWNDFKVLLGKIFDYKDIEEVVKVGELEIPQRYKKWVRRDGVDIDCIVLDTVTELVKKYQRALAGPAKKLKLQQWGEMKAELDAFFSLLNAIPISMICNVHGKLKEDNDEGVLKVMPNIEGSTKDDLGKWFDFVLYTKVVKDEKGNRHYKWVTARDEKYCHAKDRSQSLPEEMEQDYSVITNIVKDKGWDGAKILIIGDPGSGKTLSLRTINKGVNNAKTGSK